MEQPAFNNVSLNNSSDPFLNGGQQATSGSSSSTGSSNGTPSHSYKGSLTPSSPSSDEFSTSMEANGRSYNHFPYNSAAPLPKKMTDDPKLGLNNAGEHSAPKYTNIAQNPSGFSHPSLINQNVFANPGHGESHFDNIGEMNSPVVAKENIGKMTDSSRPGLPEKHFAHSLQQLPDSRPQGQNISSFFHNPSQTDSEFPLSSAPNAMPRHTPTNQYPSATNMFPSGSSVSAAQPNYSSQVTTPSKPVYNHVQNSTNETNAQCGQPVGYTRPAGQPAAFTQISKSVSASSAAPAMSPADSRPLAAVATSYDAQQPTAVSYAQIPPGTQYTLPAGSQRTQLPNARPAYPPGAPVTSAANAPASAYQNVALGQTTQPALNARSHLQSPFNSRPNVNSMGAQMLPPGSKPYSTRHPGFSNYPPAGQEREQYSSQTPGMDQQHASGNRMYEMNGHQTAAVGHHQGPAYGQQYSSVPPHMGSRYPGMAGNDMQPVDGMTRQFGGMNVTKQGYYGARGIESCDLLRMREILPKQKVEAPSIHLPPELPSDCNCDPDVFRCTLTRIPESKNLLDKSRLPLGILLHPFRDLTNLSVIQCNTIVRCRSCRTYINPFVYFMDNRHWKCNLCFRSNDLPDDFRYNPSTKMHDDPMRRPEVKNATIEFIASSEYMVRPPQPAIYLFVLDVSRIATQTGYLSTVCETLSANLGKLPGDSRTCVGFIAVDSAIRFYNLGENLNQPHELIVTDVDDVFIPCPENLLVNLHEQFELIKDLLEQIPEKFKESYDTNCALGAALQAAHKLMSATGGRVTVFVSCLPNYGPGALKPREEVAQRSNNNINLNPATDFYKKLALECNGVHIAIDLFIVNNQFVDLATISGISQISGGCMHHFPLYSSKNSRDVDKLVKTFERYLTRKIGFEAVMRLRCTKGLSIHSFHGNCFVRTTDLLALPNINPDAGFGMQVSIDENLSDLQSVCFQAALLYTSSKGERRIRVHTLCLPIANNMHDVLVSADQQCIAGLLSKMAVDRSLHSSVADAREAFVNAVCDILNAYRMVSGSGHVGSLLAPNNLALFPLYILGLMKSMAFRLGQATRTDDRVYAMYQMKSVPLDRLIQIIYPDLYPIHNLPQQPQHEFSGKVTAVPPIIQLSAERVDSTGVYLLDDGECLTIFIGHSVQPAICQNLIGFPQFSAIPDYLNGLPVVDSQENKLAHNFISYLQSKKPNPVIVDVLKDTIQMRAKFCERLVDDKNELGISYYEFLQKVSSQKN
ncbi:hypothetical protein V9T40_003573 [Parthenolecanium corni]|uniref:Protein transport protein Sec24B n=1 Tax=Parthenolecanium corni TaxID=536013 RepID=A0AAN9Y9U8_9HEMI